MVGRVRSQRPGHQADTAGEEKKLGELKPCVERNMVLEEHRPQTKQ